MTDKKPVPSPLWAHINQVHLGDISTLDLAKFKSSGPNFKISLWDPRVNGVRYLKALIYNLCAHLTPDNWVRLRRINGREVGNPIAVRYDGETVCMDYLQAVLELEFIAERVALDGASIVEIGAGYGRTCHAIVSNHDISAYYILDLESCLELARRYLSTVLEAKTLERIRFVGITDMGRVLETRSFDLCINIDSFAEMDGDTVRYYLSFIESNCDFFYVKNPVGKYLERDLDGHSQGSEAVSLALTTGLLRDVIDIHDNQAVAAHARDFVQTYRPGADWVCVADGWAAAWSHYWQALYQKTRTKGGVGSND